MSYLFIIIVNISNLFQNISMTEKIKYKILNQIGTKKNMDILLVYEN